LQNRQVEQARTENLLTHVESGLLRIEHSGLDGSSNLLADLLGNDTSSLALESSQLLAHGFGDGDSDLLADSGEVEVNRGRDGGLPGRSCQLLFALQVLCSILPIRVVKCDVRFWIVSCEAENGSSHKVKSEQTTIRAPTKQTDVCLPQMTSSFQNHSLHTSLVVDSAFVQCHV
jgi:hypothetical protein